MKCKKLLLKYYVIAYIIFWNNDDRTELAITDTYRLLLIDTVPQRQQTSPTNKKLKALIP